MVKWTKVKLQCTKTTIVLVKNLKVRSSKVLFELEFFMMTSIVVLNTQMQNIKLKCSKLIIKSNAQKKMIKYGLGDRYHDLEYFKVGTFF